MKNIKKNYALKATPEDVYTALTNPLTIEIWTGSPAVMSTEPGSEFSLWDGEIAGKNIEFEPNRRIVQQWYFDGEEPESIVTLTLNKEGAYTRVEMLHINIPDEAFENILEGWDNYYFKPLKELVED